MKRVTAKDPHETRETADTAAAAAPADLLRQAQFTALDLLRRVQGQALGAIGLDPVELAYRETVSGSHWRLRDYGGAGAGASLLIVAAPIKRPYIWDLAPSISAIHYCLAQGLRVALVEWLPPRDDCAHVGLDEYVKAISEGAAWLATEQNGTRPFLIGHSLGGTLAALFGAYEPHAIRGLVLLGAPLSFQPETGSFRDKLVAMVPPDMAETGAVPGSLLSHASAFAAPNAFVWSRLMDAAMSFADLQALDIHARVERWALDEVPLPGALVRQIVDWLYRENRFCRGALTILGREIGPSCLDLPTLAVVNIADDVAPRTAVQPILDAMPTNDVAVIEYPGETGVALQHLGILVGREAYASIWPRIMAWLRAHP